MAANTDPRVIKFCNEKVRVLADSFVAAYQSAKVFQELWNAQGMGTLIPFDSNLIADGATVDGTDAAGGDGRPLLTNAAAEQVYNFAGMIISVFERGTVDGSGSVNNTWLNNMLAVSVNGKSAF